MLQVITTKDESVTVYNTLLNATYHSIHGAIQESTHVFIQEGVEYYIIQNLLDQLNILEIGFGTGLNTLLTLHTNQMYQKEIFYDTLEPCPLPSVIVSQLNYNLPYLNEIHNCSFEKPHLITKHFTFQKHSSTLQEFVSNKMYDVIYYDAFAPTTQPELWTIPIFKKLYSLLKPQGLLVTYCSKGIVQRNMKEAGFAIQKLKGPPGKREMIRAKKRS